MNLVNITDLGTTGLVLEIEEVGGLALETFVIQYFDDPQVFVIGIPFQGKKGIVYLRSYQLIYY